VIRTNLSTRPFYNQRVVSLWLALLAFAVVVATAMNVWSVRNASENDTELAARAARDEARATELRRSAMALRASMDTRQIEAISMDARQANDLIDRRTFSWTALFNQFEATLPDEVRITSVRPTLGKDRRIVLTVIVVARSVNDIDQFMEHLDTLGLFKDLRSTQERTNDEDQIESVLEMVYVPEAATP
jgi:Tfp pilus assembly protein PilN